MSYDWTAYQHTVVTEPVRPLPTDVTQLAQLVNLGLREESGEVCGVLKKHLFHGKEWSTTLLQEEIGDVLFYFAVACHAMGWSLDDAITDAAEYGKLIAGEDEPDETLEDACSFLNSACVEFVDYLPPDPSEDLEEEDYENLDESSCRVGWYLLVCAGFVKGGLPAVADANLAKVKKNRLSRQAVETVKTVEPANETTGNS